MSCEYCESKSLLSCRCNDPEPPYCEFHEVDLVDGDCPLHCGNCGECHQHDIQECIRREVLESKLWERDSVLTTAR